MRRKHFLFLALAAAFAVLVPAGPGGLLSARQKKLSLSPDEVTARLFQLLDDSYNGKLEDFYVLGETFEDPAHPGTVWQHVLRVEYSKDRQFGKFDFYVHNISKPTPDQLKAFTVKVLYEFGSDNEKYLKSSADSFGAAGDLYFTTNSQGAVTSAPITPEVQAAYEKYVTGTILPALEKAKKPD